MTEADMIQKLKGLEDCSDVSMITQIVFDYLMENEGLGITCQLLKKPFNNFKANHSDAIENMNDIQILCAFITKAIRQIFLQFPEGEKSIQILDRICKAFYENKIPILLVKFNPLS